MRRLPALLAAAGLLCCRCAPATSTQALVVSASSAEDEAVVHREAFVTFVVSEDYVLGARVLGQSLRESGTQRRAALHAAGWALRAAPAVASPHADVAPRKLRHVYAKLAVFGLTDFARVVYLDADTLVAPGHARGADALFACRAELCAALRHSERFNSGVMVIRPSAAAYANVSALITVLPSYTGGDQGFLNSYFADLPAAPLFDPQRDATSAGAHGGSKGESDGAAQRVLRLPTAYNADVGLYVLNGERWPLPEASLRVLHFTLGPLKPWHWPATWLVPAATTWQDVRRRTPPPPGLMDFTPVLHAALLAASLLAIGPLLRRRRLLLGRGAVWGSAAAAAAALAAATPRSRRSGAGCFAARLLGTASTSAFRPLVAPPAALTALALAAALPGGAACMILAALLPPATSPPLVGWVAFQAWTLALSSLLFGAALECAHACGRAAAARACADAAGANELAAVPPAAAAARRAERMTRLAALAFAAAFIAAPWLPRAAGARGAPAMLGAAAAMAAAFAAAAAAVAPPLSAAWFAAGLAAGAPLAPAEEALPVAWRHVVVKPPKRSAS